jgi:hypothetical protein
MQGSNFEHIQENKFSSLREGFTSGKWSTDAMNKFSISPWSAASLLREDRSFTALLSTVDDEAVLISLLSKEECTGLCWDDTVSVSSGTSFCSCFPAVRIDWITPTNYIKKELGISRKIFQTTICTNTMKRGVIHGLLYSIEINTA